MEALKQHNPALAAQRQAGGISEALNFMQSVADHYGWPLDRTKNPVKLAEELEAQVHAHHRP